ncbi:hypothetical protein AB0T03_03450 [Acinetobacter baumannii]|uniref:STY1053 family phage-associated protein n=1 Tax=Acinetobacter baumannii TaxID=470 RepID=UPI00344DFD39
MSKKVQILLSKQLTVNLGKDENGNPRTLKLEAGLQEVDPEIADHWFVKAHAQEIPSNAAYTNELEGLIKEKDDEIAAMQIQLDKATEQISKHAGEIKEKDKEINDLKVLLAKVPQELSSPDEKAKEPAAKAK